jgi:hypothetical protein
VRIEATCETCDRTFLLSQIGPESDAPGRCPFCGARFARHYSTSLVDTVDVAERATANFINAISRLQEMETGFQVDLDALLKDVGDHVQPGTPQRSS